MHSLSKDVKIQPDDCWLCKTKNGWHLVLATVPTCENGSALGLDLDRNRCNGLYHAKTWTVAIGPVLPLKTRNFNCKTLAPMKYLSSDRIVTWSLCRLCRSRRSVTSRFQICYSTNIHSVAIENWWIPLEIGHNLTPTQWISLGSQIWKWEAKALRVLYNQHTDHVIIRLELKYIIAAKVEGTGKLEPQSGCNPVEKPCMYVRSG